MVFPHAARTLTAVTVDSYNEELREGEGFVGDRASGRAFRKILDRCRAQLEENGIEDPLGDLASRSISKSKLEKILNGKDPLAAGVVHTAIEEFGQELAEVIRRFLEVDAWRNTERIVVGGGLSASHIGELAMGRAAVLLADVSPVKLVPIGNHPDEAGLMGAVQLAPSWVLAGHDAVLAADIGGTNMRAGLIRFKVKDAEATKAEVVKRVHWRHADDKPSRDEAVERLVAMLREMADHADVEKLKLAPFVGLACPGLIDEHGTIQRGGQNLPGNWEGEGFNLAQIVAQKLGRIGGHEPAVVMHNDAVVQGLSEVPNMRDIENWAVLTIGTGLGNAHFVNRRPAEEDEEEKGKKAKKKEKEKGKDRDKD
ncbi:MAG: ROK family protein [Proteobacteria bacterium]|nr:ROK family protein [Pseudomonadota bacterium]